jgi:hypothetical protein
MADLNELLALANTGKENTRRPANNRSRYDFCPRCDRKGYYKVSRNYEHCRLCGFHWLLLPGQDF